MEKIKLDMKYRVISGVAKIVEGVMVLASLTAMAGGEIGRGAPAVIVALLGLGLTVGADMIAQEKLTNN